jgi:holo-[acyl-carrier protein] synthase
MGVAWKEMSVRNLPTGQPEMELHGGALKRLNRMTPKGYIAKIHVTLTDDHPWAQAFVIIEAVPELDILPLRPHIAPIPV